MSPMPPLTQHPLHWLMPNLFPRSILQQAGLQGAAETLSGFRRGRAEFFPSTALSASTLAHLSAQLSSVYARL